MYRIFVLVLVIVLVIDSSARLLAFDTADAGTWNVELRYSNSDWDVPE
jgi:hypothetical protein